MGQNQKRHAEATAENTRGDPSAAPHYIFAAASGGRHHVLMHHVDRQYFSICVCIIYQRSPTGQFHMKYKKMVLDGSKMHIQKMVKTWFCIGPKYIFKKWSKSVRGLSGRVCHRHTQEIVFK